MFFNICHKDSNAKFRLPNWKSNLWILVSWNQYLLCLWNRIIIQLFLRMAQKLNLIKRCPNCSFNSKLRRGNDEFWISYQLNHENLHRSFFPNITRVNQLRIDRLLKDSQKYNYIMTFDIQIIIFFLPSQYFLFNYQIKKPKTLCSKKILLWTSFN